MLSINTNTNSEAVSETRLKSYIEAIVLTNITLTVTKLELSLAKAVCVNISQYKDSTQQMEC